MKKHLSFVKKQIKIIENEMVRYCISGVLVTLANAMGYFVLVQIGFVYTLANMISIVISKIVGYILNKFFVYRSKNSSVKQMIAELVRFVLARGFTGIVDFFGVVILVKYLSIGEYVAKIMVITIVIILNYVIGKKVVFINC